MSARLHSFVHRLRGRPRGRARGRRATRRHGHGLLSLRTAGRWCPALETLEDRLLLSAAPPTVVAPASQTVAENVLTPFSGSSKISFEDYSPPVGLADSVSISAAPLAPWRTTWAAWSIRPTPASPARIRCKSPSQTSPIT